MSCIYGPHQFGTEDQGWVAHFLIRALKGEPITIYGDGTQTRSFCYVDDLLNGLELLMESGSDFIGPCNLGNPHEVTIAEIARMIIAQTGSRSQLIHRPLPQDDPKRRQPMIHTAREILGWRPVVPLEEGLRATIGYFALRVFAPEKEDLRAASSVRHDRRAKPNVAAEEMLH
jgi:UDP-glucuronate decarboxylase